MKYYFITWRTVFFECWCNGLVKCVPFTYQKIFFGYRYMYSDLGWKSHHIQCDMISMQHQLWIWIFNTAHNAHTYIYPRSTDGHHVEIEFHRVWWPEGYTVELHYNEDLGTMKITLLYQGKKHTYTEHQKKHHFFRATLTKINIWTQIT